MKVPSVDRIVVLGSDIPFYEKARSTLRKKRGRRLLFLEDSWERYTHFVQSAATSDPQVEIRYISSWMEGEIFARQEGKGWPFLSQEVVSLFPSPLLLLVAKSLEQTVRAQELRLSDMADFGKTHLQNSKTNLLAPFGLALDLRFPSIPAVIVGSGPSLLPARAYLPDLRKRALLLGGGNALAKMGTKPHIAAALDPFFPIDNPYLEVPFCFQARVHPQTLQRSSRRLLVPDSHMPYLNWKSGVEESFDSGWTVGTMMTALALHWGCNPIIWIGMDGVESKPSLGFSLPNRKGKQLASKRDWFHAWQWMVEKVQEHPSTTFYNVAEEGLEMGTYIPIEELSLDERTIEVPTFSPRESPVREENFPLLRDSLWDLWGPIFLRETLPGDPSTQEEKEQMQKDLFAATLREEYGNDLLS